MLMPLLDIATTPLRNNLNLNLNLYSIGFNTPLHHHASADKQTARFTIHTHTYRPRLMIKALALATLEPTSSSSSDKPLPTTNLPLPTTTDHQDDKEKLRRKRISDANKGKEAWNKGRKHSPETRQKIRERTKIAMRSPKVKMKLLKGIHSQSPETKLKIAAAVRLSWDRRRSNRKLVVRCHHEWRNLIAEACRKGLCGEEELQWDSYEIIGERLEKEFQDGLEARKKKRSSNPGIRAPKTLEQRKKISEAIAAKWADPGYRDRVYSGIAKKRGLGPETRGPEWGMKKKTMTEEAKKTKALNLNLKKREGLHGTKIRSPRAKLKASSSAIYKEPQARYKDPQARYKLEMIKSIRAQRAASDPKISEAILRANVLIGEAERAAEALEVAAAKSPVAKASLVETRKLIAEAIGYIKSIEAGSADSGCCKNESSERRGVNGAVAKFDEDAVANGTEHTDLSPWGLQMNEVEADDATASERERGRGKGRRWVCGRLIEDQEEKQ